MRVIGTAGHVDHGKSTLINALTGINPDRLKEEKERLMTIDLGFAWLTLPGGEEIGIVDVPGHRDFIENMLAGVGGVDAVLLVVAADEGVMPQTREHIAILDLLQVKYGIVVLSKIDLVKDPDWLELIESDVQTVLHGTVLQNAPIIRVSSRTKQGLPDLLLTLEKILENQPVRPDLCRPRLPIDRVFTIAGFGTILTGTLSEGQLSAGDEVEILPSGLHSRIRGLQTHKKDIKRAIPGSRLAVNLSGVNVEQVHRGHVLAYPGQYIPTQRLDVQFHLLPDVTTPLRHHTEVKFFLGTSQASGDVRLRGVEALNPGETGWLQIELHLPVIAVRGDHFILRRPSPSETLGGGTVVDPRPAGRHKRLDESLLKNLENLLQGSSEDILLQNCLALGPAVLKDVIARTRLERAEFDVTLQNLLDTSQLILIEDILIASPQWNSLKESILVTVGTYHETYPLRRGMPREELRSRLKIQPRIFNLVIYTLATENSMIENAQWVALPDHVIQFSSEQKIKINQLMAQFAMSPYSPPSTKECQSLIGEDIFSALLDSNELVAVSDEVVFRRSDYETMVEKIRLVIQKNGQISLAEARDIFNTSRRYVQALLEYLDRSGVTFRSGDFRKLKNTHE